MEGVRPAHKKLRYCTQILSPGLKGELEEKPMQNVALRIETKIKCRGNLQPMTDFGPVALFLAS